MTSDTAAPLTRDSKALAEDWTLVVNGRLTGKALIVATAQGRCFSRMIDCA